MNKKLTLLAASLSLITGSALAQHGHAAVGPSMHAAPQAISAPRATPAIPATPAVPATRTTPAVPAVPATPAVPSPRSVKTPVPVPTTDTTLNTTTQATAKSWKKTDTTATVGSDATADTTTPVLAHGAKGRAGVQVGITANAQGLYDFNGDGTITQTEKTASNRVRAALNSGTAGPAFRQIDVNGDRMLSAEELKLYNTSLARDPISVGITANAQGQFDFNGDGTISSTEATLSSTVNSAIKSGVYSTSFASIDTNRDGMLSTDELKAFYATHD